MIQKQDTQVRISCRERKKSLPLVLRAGFTSRAVSLAPMGTRSPGLSTAAVPGPGPQGARLPNLPPPPPRAATGNRPGMCRDTHTHTQTPKGNKHSTPHQDNVNKNSLSLSHFNGTALTSIRELRMRIICGNRGGT